MNRQFQRRDLLRLAAAGFGTLATGSIHNHTNRLLAASSQDEYPPQRTITRGPQHHWFAYYDKLQFDPEGRYCLGMQVDFEGRSPHAGDRLTIGMVDLGDQDRWIALGASCAWGWQQGCMLQWIPGSSSHAIWNDRQGDRFVCHILDVRDGGRRTIPHPIYCLSPDGRTAFTADFRRINDTRPGYGYAGLPDPYADQAAPAESGICRIDLETGEQDLIVSLRQAAQYPLPEREPYFDPAQMPAAKHWFNHLLVNPDGTRLEFLHRWRPADNPNRWLTRMFTCAPDGSDLRCIGNSGMVSHFIWRDPRHILAWARHPSHGDRFYVIEDREGGSYEVIGKDVMPVDGHCTYLPDRDWILNDTYPQRDPVDQRRYATVFLYHIPTNRRIDIGRYCHPDEYVGEWRVDSHPRHTPDGLNVCIDTPHTGQGRQMQMIDISGIVG
jgi:hypothetical protein